MTIKFDNDDRQIVALMLQDYGLSNTSQDIKNILFDLEDALQENCYIEELRYFVEQREAEVVS